MGHLGPAFFLGVGGKNIISCEVRGGVSIIKPATPVPHVLLYKVTEYEDI